jgi:hypothetical protein
LAAGWKTKDRLSELESILCTATVEISPAIGLNQTSSIRNQPKQIKLTTYLQSTYKIREAF